MRLAALLLITATASYAQERGFAVDRLDASAAGSRTFLVDRPWYSSFAVGLSAGWAHRVLVPQQRAPIIDQSLLAQVDLAGAFFGRVRIAASLPVSLFEAGTPEVVSGAGPLRTPSVGDPRVGVMVRLLGDTLSLHAGLDAWIPIGAAPRHLGDVGPRFMPRLIGAGALGSVGRWTAEAAFLWRPYASIGPPQLGLTAAPELRFGLAAGASLLGDRLYVGPEARFSTQVLGASAFRPTGMSLELLAGASLSIADLLLLQLAAGTSVLSAAGSPDARVLVRLAFAPRGAAPTPTTEEPPPPDQARDEDGDGVPDAPDRCPLEPESKNGLRDGDGCPEFEGDAGVALARVLTQALPKPETAADAGSTYFTADSDGDGVPDESDRCPLGKEDPDGFEDEDGCPELDNDDDGIADAADGCPNVAETFNAVDDGDGCPDLAPDADGDGVADVADRCPLEPETVDGVRDHDGCPEFYAQPALVKVLLSSIGATDSDGEGVDDAADRCPLSKEDLDGFEDEDGCPERDNDGDGIDDPKDKCPLAAETFNGWEDADGCPDEHGDLDGDGVEYERDRCPLEPGDATDGCPHLPPPALALAGFSKTAPSMTEPNPPNASSADFDRDGTPDDADKCPTSAEDRDKFEDEDGCPEPDNDADGVDDKKDKCPFVAETINGNQDDDGCPDKGTAVVHVRKGAVVIDETVQFKTASAALQPVSLKLLKQVAQVLRAERALSIEIQGHTDDVGSALTNIKLSQKRAETIRAFLVKAGVLAKRLVAKGFGPTRPRATNVTAEGREQNRRVEFLIIGEAK